MLEYNDLAQADLVAILNNQTNTSIRVDIVTANNSQQEIGERIYFSLPFLTDDEIGQVQATTVLLDIEDRISLWNSFILLSSNAGANIFYTNLNENDCLVEFEFEQQN